MLLNAVSARLDEKSFAAVHLAGSRYGLPVADVDPTEVPGYRPLDNDRALRALYLPQEGFLDARRWLATLDAALDALPQVTRSTEGRLSATARGYSLHRTEGVYAAPAVVVAVGAWTTSVLHSLDPDVSVLPVLSVEGTAFTAGAPASLPAVLRTPNRAYACGLHTVPQADGSWYVGASAAPALVPGSAPTAGGLRFLLDSALGQLHRGLATAPVQQLRHGNRPIGLDGHPLLGPTVRPGLWVATGTHRDGLHASPLIAQELAGALLHDQPARWLTPWRPDRAPISDWNIEDAAGEAADHHHALTAESRMRPPLTGSWPQALEYAYGRRMREVYAAMPEGYVLPPDLAPARLRAPRRNRRHGTRLPGPPAGTRRRNQGNRSHGRPLRERDLVTVRQAWLVLAGQALDPRRSTPVTLTASTELEGHGQRTGVGAGRLADLCRRHGIRRSMGRVGSSYDCQSFRTGSRKDRVAPAEAV
ncbi:NAD(P)/FAD-dependent oxidoreductase [Streptomyces sp. NPDC060031]|uniref:NAD(P)/FAD-dependent oxidoreductase n=1 Tax=Streptomyces sp. NPDC060031 TaxID=3347043 RepID=UPI0036754F31